MAITSAIGDIFASIGELIATFFNTLYNLVHAIVTTITGFVTSLVELIANTIGGVFNIAGETAKFLLGNAVLIIIVGGVFVGWLRYMRSQGKTVAVGDKKLN